jgi:hypothetical protein
VEYGLILVADLLEVWRAHDAGIGGAVALMGETMSQEQEAALVSLQKPWQRIAVLLPAAPLASVVACLGRHLYVRGGINDPRSPLEQHFRTILAGR